MAAPIRPRWYLGYEDLQFVFVGKRNDRRPRIGKGSYGEVYQATLESRGVKVAVKEFQYEFLKVKEHQAVFYHEVDILCGLKHPNIVDMLGASTEFADDDSTPPFIVFEFLTTTLYLALYAPTTLPAPSPLENFNTALRIAWEIASALEYLHGLKPRVVHHDLKPENVMLTAALQAKLIDFGIASTAATIANTSKAAVTTGVGTVGYMPPEMFSDQAKSLESYGESSRSHKVDLYAYGVVLWQLLSRQLPYAAKNHQSEIIAFIKSGDALPHSEAITPPLLELVNACRATDPAIRPEMSAILLQLQAHCPALGLAVVQQAPPAQPAAGSRYRALYSYDAKSGNEVSFFVDDVIINVTPQDETWLTGTVERTGQTGLLPRSLVDTAAPAV